MPPPPPDSDPQDPAIRLSALERGLKSLNSRCDDLARLLDQLLESARLASQRRSTLMTEIEALRTRVGALEEGQTGAARNMREIIDRLATTVPVQTQLDQFSSDLAGLSATLNREFSALSPRLNLLEGSQVKTADDVFQLQDQLQASVPGKARLDEMQSALRELTTMSKVRVLHLHPSTRRRCPSGRSGLQNRTAGRDPLATCHFSELRLI